MHENDMNLLTVIPIFWTWNGFLSFDIVNMAPNLQGEYGNDAIFISKWISRIIVSAS